MIEIKNIKKSYGKKRVLENISFRAKKGECIGILGANGSGKSTVLSILAGVAKSDGGSFEYDGKNLSADPKLRSELVGYVPQNTPLFDELTAMDNLLLWYTKNEIRKELCGGVLELLGIGDFLKTPVRKMSGGMKKRLSIGCAVAHKPEILLLDEPSAALDLVCRQNICNYIRSFKQSGGITVLATHDTAELDLCDTLYIIRCGNLVQYNYDGDTEKLIGELKV